MSAGFAAVPMWMLDDPRFGPNMILTYVALASHADRDGSAVPSVAALARRAHISESSVKRALRLLEEVGVVCSEAHIAGYRGQTSNRYLIFSFERRMDPQAVPPCEASVRSDSAPGHSDRPQEVAPGHTDLPRKVAPGHTDRAGSVTLTGPGRSQGPTHKELDPYELEPKELEAPPSAAIDVRSDVADLLGELDALVASNEHRPTGHTKASREAMRLLIDLDGRSPDDIRAVMRWATADPFWRANIRSATALRDRWGTLRSLMSAPTSSARRRTPAQRAEQSMRAMLAQPALAGLETR